MSLLLSHIFRIEDPESYKTHFAMWNSVSQPLDAFVRSREEWASWNAFRPEKNDFNRPYIFSLMSFYHEPNTWLFGGIYKVQERRDDAYVVELMDKGQEFIGRLKLSAKLKGRNARTKFENHYNELLVKEILPEPFSGQTFIGYEDIDLHFSIIDGIIRNQKQDWRAALQRIKGVYLIIDTNTGKKYVGSAYGEDGVWGRWAVYMLSGHGGNVELKALLALHGIDYARQYFKFTLLEFHSTRTDDDFIIAREGFWKKALLTRGDFGYNKN